MIQISRAQAIEGWMTDSELFWLANMSVNRKLIVEVGSYYGRSCRALADNTKGSVIAIDTWRGPVSLENRVELPSFEEKFRENLSDLIASQKVVPLTPDARVLELCHPDMVFVDADHESYSVRKDLATWWPRLRRGGLLSGHDYSCPDVRNAVTSYLPEICSVPGTDIWFTTKM